ncbi:unnamed protein product [Closterium sp. Naga37s-1]|nr:unnamed protein product [Closterium sp. Naga37s-1]
MRARSVGNWGEAAACAGAEGDGRTAVVLLGWLGAQQRHMRQYATWYNARGIDAIGFVIPFTDIFSVRLGEKAELHVDDLVTELERWLLEGANRGATHGAIHGGLGGGGRRSLLFHTFSNTGWIAYGAALLRLQRKYGKAAVDGIIKGCVVDSAPILEEDPKSWTPRLYWKKTPSSFFRDLNHPLSPPFPPPNLPSQRPHHTPSSLSRPAAPPNPKVSASGFSAAILQKRSVGERFFSGHFAELQCATRMGSLSVTPPDSLFPSFHCHIFPPTPRCGRAVSQRPFCRSAVLQRAWARWSLNHLFDPPTSPPFPTVCGPNPKVWASGFSAAILQKRSAATCMGSLVIDSVVGCSQLKFALLQASTLPARPKFLSPLSLSSAFTSVTVARSDCSSSCESLYPGQGQGSWQVEGQGQGEEQGGLDGGEGLFPSPAPCGCELVWWRADEAERLKTCGSKARGSKASAGAAAAAVAAVAGSLGDRGMREVIGCGAGPGNGCSNGCASRGVSQQDQQQWLLQQQLIAVYRMQAEKQERKLVLGKELRKEQEQGSGLHLQQQQQPRQQRWWQRGGGRGRAGGAASSMVQACGRAVGACGRVAVAVVRVVKVRLDALESVLVTALWLIFQVALRIPYVKGKLGEVTNTLHHHQPNCPQLYFYMNAFSGLQRGPLSCFAQFSCSQAWACEGGEATTMAAADNGGSNELLPRQGNTESESFTVSASLPEPEIVNGPPVVHMPVRKPESLSVGFAVPEEEKQGAAMWQGILDDQFTQLQQLQDESNPEFVGEVIGLFFEDSVKLLDDLTQEVNEDPIDFKKVDAHVHQFKGSSSSIGAQRVKALCIKMRGYCDEGNRAKCLSSLDKIKDEFNLVKDKLELMMSLERKILAKGGKLPSMEY